MPIIRNQLTVGGSRCTPCKCAISSLFTPCKDSTHLEFGLVPIRSPVGRSGGGGVWPVFRTPWLGAKYITVCERKGTLVNFFIFFSHKKRRFFLSAYFSSSFTLPPVVSDPGPFSLLNTHTSILRSLPSPPLVSHRPYYSQFRPPDTAVVIFQ